MIGEIARHSGADSSDAARRRRRYSRGLLGLGIVLGLAGCGGSQGSPAGAGPATDPSAVGSAKPQPQVRDLGASDAHALLQTRGDVFILDVRLPPEWDDDLGHLDFATQIPVQDLPHRLDDLPPEKDRPILVYCRNGLRSSQATQILAANGYLEIYLILGGLEAYRQAGY